MRKVFMTMVVALALMGTTFTTKAASLLKLPSASTSQSKDNGLVLKHASQIYGTASVLISQHVSHSSHGSHGSHGSHSSHSSHTSHYSSS
jgi:hypothetical protein